MNGAKLSITETAASSYFWGAPPNYKGASWPYGRRLHSAGDQQYALVFVACIDLGEVHRFVPWLPESGRLLFFIDDEDQPWGLYPEERESWRVVYVAEKDLLSGFCEAPGELGELAEMPATYVEFSPISQDAEPELSADTDEPRHQIGGVPQTVQDDQMPTMCQVLSNGFRLENDPHLTEEIFDKLVPGISDWRLLLQSDTDDDLPSMWGDCGRVYFWVREQDARAGDFRNVWMIMQSY